jgi:hypothetical protein
MPPINRDIYAFSPLKALDGAIDRIVTGKRREMLARIEAAIADDAGAIQTVLDIGSTRDNDMAASNYLARALSRRYAVTLLSDQRIDPRTDLNFPVAATILGDAAAIDPGLGPFDLVVSNATIEHVGDAAHQAAMLESCLALARRWVVITTPSRWHPIEFHTRLPLLHWLPKTLHRRMLRRLGLSFFATEEHLNLLDRRDLERMMTRAAAKGAVESWRIETVRFLGFVSNLVLVVQINTRRGPS